jgi:hypothetical protein
LSNGIAVNGALQPFVAGPSDPHVASACLFGELGMSTDQLVLLKSRNQRLAEMFIFPLVALLVGPILRALLGDS